MESIPLYSTDGWLVFDFGTAPDLEVYVDEKLIPSLQKEWAVSANTDHIVKVLRGSIVKWTATVNVPTNTVRHCPT